MQRSTEADEQPPSALQDLLNDVQVVTNTVGAPLAALAGTTKVFAQGVASQVCAGSPSFFSDVFCSHAAASSSPLPRRRTSCMLLSRFAGFADGRWRRIVALAQPPGAKVQHMVAPASPGCGCILAVTQMIQNDLRIYLTSGPVTLLTV